MPTLTAGAASVQVDAERGGRLASLVVHRHELLVQPEPAGQGEAGDPMRSGSFPMAPFAGRTRGGRFAWAGQVHELEANHGDHAMHGTVYERPWQVEPAAAGGVRLRTDLQPGWPFEGWVVQEVSLTDGRLDLRLEVHTAGTTFPATTGWHPWFRRRLDVGGDLEVTLDADQWFPRGADGLPLGHVEPVPAHGPWDDCFTAITWPAQLHWPGALDLAMTSTCSHAVRFDQQPDGVCVEPQTGPPDALNHLEWATLVRLDQPVVAEMSLTWSGS